MRTLDLPQPSPITSAPSGLGVGVNMTSGNAVTDSHLVDVECILIPSLLDQATTGDLNASATAVSLDSTAHRHLSSFRTDPGAGSC